MDPLRYPIGQFVSVTQLSPEQRGRWIDSLSEVPRNLKDTVSGLTMEQLQTPYRPGGWTVLQVVHHMADNDMNAYFRFKRALTEENPQASSYREDLWAELCDYKNVPVETSINLFEALHSRFTILLRALAPGQFQRTFTTEVLGNITLDVALQRFVWHNNHHMAQIAGLKERMGW